MSRHFPSLTSEIADARDLLHVVMGHVGRYAEEQIASSKWTEAERVFSFLTDVYSQAPDSLENPLRVSFLEYFDFHGEERRVREMFGSVLEALYDDQMRYMEDLARRGPTGP